MVLFSEMFVSDLVGDPIVDRVQENIGRVKDVIITLGEVFPKVTGLVISLNEDKKQEKVLLIAEIDLIGKQFVSTRSTKDRVAFATLRSDDVLLMRDVIDQQVVDLEGARVIRVNDLKLAKVDQDVRLIAVDVGLRGMLRRIGLLEIASWLYSLFKKEVPEKMIGWDHIQNLSGGQVSIASKSFDELHPADVAQVISQLKIEDRGVILSGLSDRTAAEALHELEPMIAAVLINNLDTKKALGIIDRMPVDEVADVLGDLPPEKTDELLRLMKVRKAGQIRELLKHKDETAGGLMTPEFIALPQSLTVEQVIQRLRENAPAAETIYYLYVVDENERLVGVLSLRSMIISAPEKLISEVMIKDPLAVPPEMNQREVASLISKYNLLAVPVVDQEHKILGIVTVDDVVDFILPPFSRRKSHMLG